VILSPKAFRLESIELQETAMAYAEFAALSAPVPFKSLSAVSVSVPVPLVITVAVSALDPWALLQAGFWLSFVAVGLLMASSPVRQVARMESGDGLVREAGPGLHPGYEVHRAVLQFPIGG